MTKQERLERLEKYQKLYETLSVRFEKLLEFENNFKEYSDELFRLEEYYHSDWIDDTGIVEDDKQADKISIVGQDTIWDLLSEHYEYNKRLLKVLADELND